MRTLNEILKDELSASHPLHCLDQDFDSLVDDCDLFYEIPASEEELEALCAA